jgi:hypothetical protein
MGWRQRRTYKHVHNQAIDTCKGFADQVKGFVALSVRQTPDFIRRWGGGDSGMLR